MSTVAGVKAALVALLGTACPAATVLYGPRNPESITDDQVIVVGDARGTVEAAALDVTRSAEDYTVAVTCSVSLTGGDVQQAATEAALALYGAAELAVRTGDATLGVPGVLGARATGEFALSEPLVAGACNAAVVWSVRVQARP